MGESLSGSRRMGVGVPVGCVVKLPRPSRKGEILRVITQVLQRFAQACKSRISRQFSFLRFALRCTVLRSRWYQSGINVILVSTRD
jgi:hypothetical protein